MLNCLLYIRLTVDPSLPITYENYLDYKQRAGESMLAVFPLEIKF